MTYRELIARKAVKHVSYGLPEVPALRPALFDYQTVAVDFALRKGRAALFLDTGLGKTLCQAEWSSHIPGKVLILAPVAVAPQTVREAREKLGLDIHHSRDGKAGVGITITNYERLHLFDVSEFHGVVLDESSILKSFMGKTTRDLMARFFNTPFRLCCSATPAPNDYIELGNHAEFLGAARNQGMLARFFINDTSDTGTWRLKGHAVEPFWKWVASWAVCASKPSDLGGDDSRHILPPLSTDLHVVESEMQSDIDNGFLFRSAELSATSMHRDKRATLKERVARAAELADTGDFCIVWCQSNDESAALHAAISDSVEVKGADDMDSKEAKIDAFSKGQVRVMVSKGSICGHGLNWQHCAHQVHASLSYSYEEFYQEIRRSWRFGQKRPVHIDCVIADSEQSIWRAIQDKLANHDQMKEAMRFATPSAQQFHRNKITYAPKQSAPLPLWI